MIKTKICFKCGNELPLSDFYSHPQMKDGHLNKCKNCTRNDVKKRYEILSLDENWMDKQRKRGRDKFTRLGYKYKINKDRKKIYNNPNISRDLKSLGYDTYHKEAHHWNYNLPHSIFLINRKIHKLLHKYIIVNYKDKYCYTIYGEKIDTEDKAIDYFNKILQSNGITAKINIINF